MKYFYFIRHAPTANNINKIRCGGDLDIPLIGDFQPFLEDALLEIRELFISKIYTSSLIRTKDTAAFITQKLNINIKITIDDRIKERSLGKLNFLDIKSTQAIIRNPPDIYEAEDNQIFTNRVLNFINHIKTTECSNLNATLVVSSKGVARILTENFKFEKVSGENDIYANCQLIKFFLD